MTENKKAHFMTHRYKYRARGPGQPPQLPSANGTGYCVQTGMRITTFAPEEGLSRSRSGPSTHIWSGKR